MATAFDLTRRTIERWLKQLKESAWLNLEAQLKQAAIIFGCRRMNPISPSNPLLADVRLLIDALQNNGLLPVAPESEAQVEFVICIAAS